MNPNQTIQTIARVAPPLLLVVLAGLAIKSLFSGEKKTEAALVSVPKNVPFFPLISVPAMPKNSASAPFASVPISEDLPQSGTPQRRRIVLRDDLVRIFQNGTRSLYRTEAVVELQELGFGKTAAYEALSPDGKFASWLKIAPDGKISWKAN